MAYNSTIPNCKQGKCIICNDGIVKDGRKVAKDFFCLHHHSNAKKHQQLEKIKEKQKLRSLIHTPNNLETKGSMDLALFFKNSEAEVAKHPYCSECGSWIPSDYYRSAVAHIFMKSIFKSIAAHPLNYLILSAGCGCHDKTHTLSDFSKMKVFKVAIEKFKQFESEIKERHKYLNEFKKLVYGDI